jgi:hypothetical protein
MDTTNGTQKLHLRSVDRATLDAAGKRIWSVPAIVSSRLLGIKFQLGAGSQAGDGFACDLETGQALRNVRIVRLQHVAMR